MTADWASCAARAGALFPSWPDLSTALSAASLSLVILPGNEAMLGGLGGF